MEYRMNMQKKAQTKEEPDHNSENANPYLAFRAGGAGNQQRTEQQAQTQKS